MLYCIVLVSAVQQFESVVIIRIVPPWGASLFSLPPTPLGHHRAPGGAACVISVPLSSSSSQEAFSQSTEVMLNYGS